jgi:hypothetical protein
MRTLPTAWVRLREPTLLTLGGQRATMAAVVGEAARLELDVDVGGLRLQEAVLRLPRELL